MARPKSPYTAASNRDIMDFAISYSCWNRALNRDQRADRDNDVIVWGEMLLKDAEKLGSWFSEEIDTRTIRRVVEHARERRDGTHAAA